MQRRGRKICILPFFNHYLNQGYVKALIVAPTQVVVEQLSRALVSGVQMSISASNKGGSWDNVKKYIEAGFYKNEAGEVKKKLIR